MTESRWANAELWIEHDGSDVAVQQMEDLMDLVMGVLVDVLEDTPWDPHWSGTLNGDAPDWASAD
jgi:hypothetical protein